MTGKLRIVPLGGLGEVGKNMLAIEYGRNIIIIDAGVAFPDSDMPGVDYIIPDWGYLRDKGDLIRAILITHGHLDHVGALMHLLGEFDAPVYATRLTRGLIEAKLKRERMLKNVELHTYAAGDVIEIGPFTIEPYHVCHSIPDSVGLGITTPAGLIVHTGDFKLDATPVDGRATDMAKLAEFGERGVLALLADSTNADRPGFTPSEATLDASFDRIMDMAPGRLIIATFSSLVSRVQQIINSAERHGRKVTVAGRSMVENIQLARELGYLDVPQGMIVSLDKANTLPAEQVVIIATGSQGEPMAALNRLATNNHPSLQLRETDTVLLSSHTIPGNEEVTNGLINRLFKRGADVHYGPLAEAHVSGHASQDELRQVIEMLRPRFFVPVHGELRHLAHHARLARELGIPKERIAVVENGYPVSFGAEQVQIGARVPGENVYVIGSQVSAIDPEELRQRDTVTQGSFVTTIARYDRQTGQTVGTPRIITSGLVHSPNARRLLAQAGDIVRNSAAKRRRAPMDEVEEEMQEALARLFYRETRQRPTVTVALMEV